MSGSYAQERGRERERARAALTPGSPTPAARLLSRRGSPQQMAYPAQLQQQPMPVTQAPAYQQVLPRAEGVLEDKARAADAARAVKFSLV